MIQIPFCLQGPACLLFVFGLLNMYIRMDILILYAIRYKRQCIDWYALCADFDTRYVFGIFRSIKGELFWHILGDRFASDVLLGNIVLNTTRIRHIESMLYAIGVTQSCHEPYHLEAFELLYNAWFTDAKQELHRCMRLFDTKEERYLYVRQTIRDMRMRTETLRRRQSNTRVVHYFEYQVKSYENICHAHYNVLLDDA
jgi:hypothetical protein